MKRNLEERVFVGEIHSKFMEETRLHCRKYDEASNKLEEMLNDSQKKEFELFKLIAYMESRDRERVLIQFVLDYLDL